MNIVSNRTNYNTNHKNNINFKGDAEVKLFQSVVKRKIDASDGAYRKALKGIYEELVSVFKNKYTSKFSQAETHPNEFSINMTPKNTFKVEYKKGKLECKDKGKSYEKRMGKLVSKSITNEVQYEAPATKPIIKKREYTTITKDYAPMEVPFQKVNEQIYDKELKIFLNA